MEDDPTKRQALLDAEIIEGLRDESGNGTNQLVNVAHALLDGPHAALGIMFTRGLLVTADLLDGLTLLETLLKTRDRLELPPDDPSDDLFDQRFFQQSTTDPNISEELTLAQQRLSEKSDEIRRLKQSLDSARMEIENRQSDPPHSPISSSILSPPSSLGPAPVVAEDPVLAALRQKVEHFRTSLRERHNERNQLRRELQDTRAALAALQDSTLPNPGPLPALPTAEKEEEDLLVDSEALGTQPVRVTHFPRKFAETLRALPRHVAQAVVVSLGRLAAGDPAAFVGTKRLHSQRSILRQRIAGDYRLLFALEADALVVHDVIHRRDLERWLKTAT